MYFNITNPSNLRLRIKSKFDLTLPSSQILLSGILPFTGREVYQSMVLLMSDKASFIGLREVYWSDITEQQIERWYGYFMSAVQKYDDIINNHIRFSHNCASNYRDKNAQKAFSSSARAGSRTSHPTEVTSTDDESESDFQSADEDDEEKQNRNCTIISI
jgi:hypothetical protein